ncbi:MAG TPA: murein transglycosylase A [Usitatibacter sp.]|jgi:membrane-bound lytic murein transglycosylase A|nr:murein transglycosylase A [Usitatibacter sp.]
MRLRVATLSSNARAAIGALLVAVAAGCATPPAAPPPVEPQPAKVAAAPEPLACPPAEKPVCPAQPVPQPPVPEVRGKLVPGAWPELTAWGTDTLRPSLEAFVRSCDVLEKQDAWKVVCAAGRTLLPGMSESDVRSFFELNFDPWRVLNLDDSDDGMITGYYEPLLRGSLTPSPRYRYPIYAVPDDLLVIDLSSVYPELKHKRLRGRLEGKRVVPYLSRGEIDTDTAPLHGRELVWVDDPIDLFFLHIQGSGQVELENGERMRVGYADQNGHPFRSLGRVLIDRGEIAPERASMQGIKEWARRNPRKVQEYLDTNPSYVFFRELPRDLPGPLGALGVPLTPERSIAIDARVIPLGAPVYLATTWPNTPEPLDRLMVAQDTGGAIAGGVRADFFWGFGDEAGALAGRMRQAGRMWVLMPKGVTPPNAAGASPAPAPQ